MVISIEREIYKIPRHPVTESGTIIVNDKFVSCHNGLNKDDHIWSQHLMVLLHQSGIVEKSDILAKLIFILVTKIKSLFWILAMCFEFIS